MLSSIFSVRESIMLNDRPQRVPPDQEDEEEKCDELDCELPAIDTQITHCSVSSLVPDAGGADLGSAQERPFPIARADD